MIKSLTKSLLIISLLLSTIFSFGQTLTYSGGTWSPFAPSDTTSSYDIIIDDIECNMPHSSVVNNLTINDDMSIKVLANPVTILGDLTIGRKAAYEIGYDGVFLTVLGTTTISTQGSSSTGLYNIWSSPFPDGDLDILGSFPGTNPCDIYGFEATTQTFRFDYSVPFSTTCNGNSVTFRTNDIISAPEGNPDGKFDLGRGYFIPGNSPSTRVFTSSSTPNNGVINIPIYGSSVAVAGGNDWNLIGNPYISALANGATIQLNSSLINAIYIYTAGTGAYTAYNSTSSFRISTCQGFFIDANTTTDGYVGDFQFNNSLRRASNLTFRSNDDTEIMYLSLKGASDTISDQLQILTCPDCKDDFDRKYDARKLLNPNNLNFSSLLDFGSSFGQEPCVFNGLKTFENQESKSIPLYVELPSADSYTIDLDSIINLSPGMSIILEDVVSSSFTDLNTQSYTFTSISNDTLSARFILHLSYQPNPNGVDEILNPSHISIYANQSNIEIKSINPKNHISTIAIFDIAGKLVYQNSTPNPISSIHIPKSGTYVVRVTDSNGFVSTKKVVI